MEGIPETLTQQDFAEFLSKRTLGIQCPICRRENFSALGKNGFVRSVRLIDDKGMEAIIKGLTHRDATNEDIEKWLEGTIFSNIAVIRCKNCGWVGLFDKTFIEECVRSKRES